MRGGRARAIGLGLLLLAVPQASLYGEERDPDPTPRHAALGVALAPPDTVPRDTLRTRADSLRAVVLDRVRSLSEPLPDTLPEDPDLPADPSRDGVDAVRPAPARDGRTPPRAVPPPAGADSVMRALLRLPGYSPATYEGTRADYEAAERRLVLFGTDTVLARFSGQGMRLEADTSITYDDREGFVRTRGRTLFTPDQGDPVRSSALVYDVAGARGTAWDAETTYQEGTGNWIVRGNLDSVEDGLLFGSATRFTSCELDPPHSYFQAQELKVVRDRVLVARSVRLYFDDVPVAWLPFIAQPLSEGRASGLLTPRFSVNDVVRTSSGTNRRVSNIGYFWAMSDYSDATLAMDWWSNNYTAMTGSLRYRWARRFLGGDISTRRFWRDDGRRDFAVSTRNNWEITERSRLNVSGNYVTSTGLVRRSSMESRELTGSIDSNAGLQHRFDWGNLSVSARRQQFLTDDRVEMTLPNASLSISTFTLFPEAPAQARWFNNLSVSGSGSFQRDTRDFPFQPDTIFRFQRTDQTRTQASGRASANLGNLSLAGQTRYQETFFPSVPRELVGPGDALGQDGELPPLSGERVSFQEGRIDWSTSLSYQQRLMASSTVTPSLSLSGQLLRVDSIPEAVRFVEGPTRVSFGLAAQTEIFGFYRGFGPFEAFRHKVTPGVSYAYAPEIAPTQLQRRVFGARDLRVQNQFTLSFNQTWEAKLREPEEEPDDDALEAAEELLEEEDPDLPDEERLPLSGDQIEDEIEGLPEPPALEELDPDQPRRLPESRVVTVLALSTSGITYDLVERDSTGRFLDGIRETQIRNTVRSDFLRGLDLSFTHDLFDVVPVGEDDRARRLRPHLSQLALGFSMNHRSGIVRFLGRVLGADEPDTTPPAERQEEREDEDPFDLETQDRRDVMDGFDESRILPGSPGDPSAGMRPRRDGWDARISYSLRRPRETGQQPAFGAVRSQMISGTLSFQPTAQWDATWQTSFDVEEQRFNDHMLRLRRDLHEWEASFGFRQAANGNWSFQFEVSLKANRDLRFDYEQRNVEGSDAFDGPAGPFF